MSQGEPAAPLGAVGRADLLRALAVAPRERLALDLDAGFWFGYVRQPEQPAPRSEAPQVIMPPAGPKAAPGQVAKLPLRLPFIHAIVERLPRQITTPEPRPHEPGGPVEPIDEAAAQAPSPVCLVGYEDLVPQARLLPALRRFLGATRAGPLDLERITRQLAARELPRYLPRRRFQRWHPELVVVLDFCARLWPYRHDMHRLAKSLLRHCGRSGVQLRIINRGPFGTWSDWVAYQNPQATVEPPEHDWQMPSTGAPVLIVSDLGLLLGAQSAPCQAWARFIAELRRAELRPLALAPLGVRQLDQALAQALPILRWSPDAGARPAQAHGAAQPESEGLEELLAMTAATRRVDPPLLRAMRKLNSRAPLDAGLEGALWCHPDVEPGVAASIRQQAREPHLRRFAQLLPQLQAELDTLRGRHHAHLRAVLNHEETLLWRAQVGDAAVEASPGAVRRIEDAQHFMGRLGATLAQPGAGPAAAKWLGVAQEIVQRADAAMGAREAALLHPLLAALVRARGDRVAVPEWADPAALASLIGDDRPPERCWLVRDAASGCLRLQAHPPDARQSPLGEPLVIDAGGLRLRVEGETGSFNRWLSASTLPAPLAALRERVGLRLDTARETITVAPVERPRGVAGWGCDGKGISIRSPRLGGFDARWGEAALGLTGAPQTADGVPLWALEKRVADEVTLGLGRSPRMADGVPLWTIEGETADHIPKGGQLQFGIDPVFGVWADLTVSTRHGDATQRLRWIEPGTFLMGSPEDEPERQDPEGPQHPVTLTRGFWLADTACTQALWQAVMGSNPSRFTGDPQRPVEQVSWQDVQAFLRKLEALLPGCEAGLPSEAQWEYACRAGTESPFSFGTQITPEQVNYDGNYPYAGGKKGLYREETVQVKSLPPNAWGLYEMHGNVDEWCADGLRTYEDEPQEDPQGPGLEDKEALRAIRGGSWIINARWARSAYRIAYHPGYRVSFLGFRLCLRSIEPGQVEEPGRSGGPVGAASGGRSRSGKASAERSPRSKKAKR